MINCCSIRQFFIILKQARIIVWWRGSTKDPVFWKTSTIHVIRWYYYSKKPNNISCLNGFCIICYYYSHKLLTKYKLQKIDLTFLWMSYSYLSLQNQTPIKENTFYLVNNTIDIPNWLTHKYLLRNKVKCLLVLLPYFFCLLQTLSTRAKRF